MIDFIEGKFPESFSKGELYEFNPVTLDARNSGTMASMCGLERALNNKDAYQTELAIKRILLLNSIIISYTGIPLLYSGDEIGALNYYDYKNNPEECGDSRWLHREPMDWKKAENRKDKTTVEGIIFNKIKEMIEIRKNNSEFSSLIHSQPVFTGNKGVFAFHKEDKMLVLANFTEHEQRIDANSVNWFGLPNVTEDMIQGKKVKLEGTIVLGPYEYLWLK